MRNQARIYLLHISSSQQVRMAHATSHAIYCLLHLADRMLRHFFSLLSYALHGSQRVTNPRPCFVHDGRRLARLAVASSGGVGWDESNILSALETVYMQANTLPPGVLGD